MRKSQPVRQRELTESKHLAEGKQDQLGGPSNQLTLEHLTSGAAPAADQEGRNQKAKEPSEKYLASL
jgi:hypothetical protein